MSDTIFLSDKCPCLQLRNDSIPHILLDVGGMICNIDSKEFLVIAFLCSWAIPKVEETVHVLTGISKWQAAAREL